MAKKNIFKVNMCRVVPGGALAGGIIYIVAAITNGSILGGAWQAWMKSSAGLAHPPSMNHSVMLWAIICLIYGIVGVWIYAGIRPRYGAGPKTALLAGLLVWMVTYLAMWLDYTALGIIPHKIACGHRLLLRVQAVKNLWAINRVPNINLNKRHALN